MESNVKNFEIERSVDGSVFLPRGITDSKAIGGNSASILHYTYADILYPTSPFLLFYRLREADLDGRFTYSPVLTIGAPPGSLRLSVYPNPFRQQVTIVSAPPKFGHKN